MPPKNRRNPFVYTPGHPAQVAPRLDVEKTAQHVLDRSKTDPSGRMSHSELQAMALLVDLADSKFGIEVPLAEFSRLSLRQAVARAFKTGFEPAFYARFRCLQFYWCEQSSQTVVDFDLSAA